jgi:hypothetical protein
VNKDEASSLRPLFSPQKSRGMEIYPADGEPKNEDEKSTTEYAKSTRQKRQLLVVFARCFLT